MLKTNVASIRQAGVALALVAGGLTACTLQPPARTALPAVQAQWSQPTPTVPLQAPAAHWWRGLNDPGLDALVQAAQADSPTVQRALARVEELRAQAGVSAASAGPALQAAGQARHSGASGNASAQTSLAASLSVSWELDLFGRLRHDQASAHLRLQSGEADAQAARLSLQGQVAEAVINTRACSAQAKARDEDVRSRQATLRLTKLRYSVGQVSAMEVARAGSSLADAQINRVSTGEQCAQGVQQLATLTGWPTERVTTTLQAAPVAAARAVPEPPAALLALPASVLAGHPSVVAALRQADAAWEDIGAADAARRPSVNLAALLAPTWLRAAGGWVRSSSDSITPQLTGSLWDGGRAQAQWGAARARHAQALATLQASVRTAVQEVEDALTLASHAQEREALAQAGATAAAQLLHASQASHQAGRMSLFELEDARRSVNNAQSALITAQRDRARAWVSLVKATGNVAAFSWVEIPLPQALWSAPESLPLSAFNMSPSRTP